MNVPLVTEVLPVMLAPLLKVAKPPTCKPPVVIETAFECTVGKPVVVNAAPLTARPPPAVNNPPTLKIPASEAFPIVRVPIYAEAVLIVVVDIPPLKVAKPVVTSVVALKLFIMPVDVEIWLATKLQVNIELVLIMYVLREVATISPIFIYPNDVPIVRELTVNDEINPVTELIVVKLPFTELIVLIVPKLVVRIPINPLEVLIVVVDKPLLAVSRPPTPNVPELLKFPLFEILVKDPPLPDTRTPVNPEPSPVNLPLKLPYPAVVENVDI